MFSCGFILYIKGKMLWLEENVIMEQRGKMWLELSNCKCSRWEANDYWNGQGGEKFFVVSTLEMAFFGWEKIFAPKMNYGFKIHFFECCEVVIPYSSRHHLFIC